MSSAPQPVQSQHEPPLGEGDILAEKYRVTGVLGEGGMGYVFAAEHMQLGHKVALKVLRSSALQNRDAVERFLREGRAVARLQSEHICRVSDVGMLPNGEPYMVMEYLEGTDLAHVLRARSPLPLEEAVDYMLQTCEALAVAHSRGIIHRDLKPANLFLTTKIDGEEILKVLDFGISKTTAGTIGEEVDSITVTSTFVGTPKYMSPEQIQDSRSVDARADIWALGAIFYELLTSTRPFAAPTLAMTCVKILNEQTPAPSTIVSSLPVGIDSVVARCLEKRFEDRYLNVGEFAEALAAFGPPNAKAAVQRITRILTADLNRTGTRTSMESTGAYVASTLQRGGFRVGMTPSEVRIPLRQSGSGITPLPISQTPEPPMKSTSPTQDAVVLAQTQEKKRPMWLWVAIALVLLGAGAFAARGIGGPGKAETPAGAKEAEKPKSEKVAPDPKVEPSKTVVAEPKVVTAASSEPTAAKSAVPAATEVAPVPDKKTGPVAFTRPKPAATTTAAVVTPPTTPVPTATEKPKGGPDGVLDDRK